MNPTYENGARKEGREDGLDDEKRKLNRALTDARRNVGRIDERIVAFAKSQPLAAACAALAAGFVIGRLLSRRSY